MEKQLLFIRFSALGDILLTFPALKKFRQLNPGAAVHFLTKEKFSSILIASGLVDKVHTIPNHASLFDLYRTVRALKTFRYSLVFDLHRNLRSRLVSFWLGRPYRRVRKHRFLEWFLFLGRKSFFRFFGFSELSRWNEACRTVLGDESSSVLLESPLVDFSLFGNSDFSESLSKKKYICICAESAWPQKQWLAERFIEVATDLTRKGHSVVWLGLEPIADVAKIEGTIDFTAKLSITETAFVLQNAKLLICNDSGLMHLAEVAGLPVIAIFGPTTRELGFAPRLSKSKIVETDLWCRPCSKTGRLCFRIQNRRQCLTDVTVEMVLNATYSALID